MRRGGAMQIYLAQKLCNMCGQIRYMEMEIGDFLYSLDRRQSRKASQRADWMGVSRDCSSFRA